MHTCRRHDVQDQFASLLTDVCHDVEVEPHLQTLTGEALNSSSNSSDEELVWMSVHTGFGKGSNVHFLCQGF